MDFPLFSTFKDSATKGSLGGIKAALDLDYAYIDTAQLVIYFRDHDMGTDNDFKFRYCCKEANTASVYNLL